MSRLNQLVTLPEWEAYRYIMASHGFQIDAKDFPFISLFYPKITILFSEEDKKLYADKFRLICTAIVVRPPTNKNKPNVFCIIDVLKKDELLKFRFKKEFFIKRQLSYFVLLEDEPNQIYDSSGIPCNTTDFKLGSAFNYFQFESISSFFVENISEKGEVFSIVHEPSLDMIFSVGEEGNKIINKINSEVIYDNPIVNQNFLINTSVDAVFCVDMPYGIPLFAIEYDGKHHDEPDQISKDKVKDLIFNRARIPLLRVKSGLLNPNDQFWELKCQINKEITHLLLEILLNTRNYVSMMLGFLKNEADKLKKTSNPSSFNIALLCRLWNF